MTECHTACLGAGSISAWPATVVAVVLFVTTGALMLTALRKDGGVDNALKIWAAMGTFLSAIIGGVLGVGVGEAQGDAAVAQAREERAVTEAEVVEAKAHLREEATAKERLSEKLEEAEWALIRTRFGKKHLETPAEAYVFRSERARALNLPALKLHGELDPDSIKEFQMMNETNRR